MLSPKHINDHVAICIKTHYTTVSWTTELVDHRNIHMGQSKIREEFIECKFDHI